MTSGRRALHKLTPPLVAGFLAVGFLGIAPPSASADARLCADYQPCAALALTDHGWAAHQDASYWGMYAGHNCTNYVAFMMDAAGVARPAYSLGNAESWGPAAQAHGVPVDDTPTVGAVAWWSSGAGGVSTAGHVAYVQAVSGASITVSEDNYPAGPFDYRVIDRASTSWPTGFIHFTSSGVTTAAAASAVAPLRLAALAPSIARGPGGATVVAAIGQDHSIVLYSHATVAGSSAGSIGSSGTAGSDGTSVSASLAWSTQILTAAGAAYSAPSLVLGPGGLAAVAVAGSKGELLVYGRATAGSEWTVERVAGPASVAGAPSAVLDRGTLQIAARSSAGALKLYSTRLVPAAAGAATAAVPAAAPRSRTWLTTTIAGPGAALSRPAIIVGAGHVTEVAAVGAAHSLVLYSGGPGVAWRSRVVATAGTAYADPSIGRGAGTELEIATLGRAGSTQLYRGAPTGRSWAGRELSGPRSSALAPALISAPGARTSVVVVARNGRLRVYSTVAQDGSWGVQARSWTSSAVVAGAGTATSSPTAVTDTAGTAQLAAVDPAGALDLYTRQGAGAWTVVSPGA